MALTMEEMLNKYCPNWNVDASIPMEDARKLIKSLVSKLYFPDGTVKWKEVPDFIRDPNNGRPRPKKDELMAMLIRLVEEYRAREMGHDGSDVVALQEESEENVNATLEPTTCEVDAPEKYGDDDDGMLFLSFDDQILKLRDILMKLEGTKYCNAYLNLISHFVDKLDLMDRDDPNSLIAVRFIECVMKAYCTMNVMNGGYFEKMKTFVEHGNFEWNVKATVTDEDLRSEESSSSKFTAIAEMCVNIQYPNPHGRNAVNSQNSNNPRSDAIGQQRTANVFKSISAVEAMQCDNVSDDKVDDEIGQSSDAIGQQHLANVFKSIGAAEAVKCDAIGQQHPANVFAVKSIGAVDTVMCYNLGDDTVDDEIGHSTDGTLDQIPADEMLAENPKSCEEFFWNKKSQEKINSIKISSFEKEDMYGEDPWPGLHPFWDELNTDLLNSSNFPE